MLNGKILVRWYFLRYSIDLFAHIFYVSMDTFIYKVELDFQAIKILSFDTVFQPG